MKTKKGKASVRIVPTTMEDVVIEQWEDSEGRIHRSNKLPAIIYSNGCELYYVHGVYQYQKGSIRQHNEN